MTRRNEVCPRCGAQITQSRVSFREMAVTALCGCLLLAILVPACWMTEQWIERQSVRIFDRLVWHEPLDGWNW